MIQSSGQNACFTFFFQIFWVVPIHSMYDMSFQLVYVCYFPMLHQSYVTSWGWNSAVLRHAWFIHSSMGVESGSLYLKKTKSIVNLHVGFYETKHFWISWSVGCIDCYILFDLFLLQGFYTKSVPWTRKTLLFL